MNWALLRVWQTSSFSCLMPNVPPTQEDLAYVVHFRKTCQRYQIDFVKVDQDERNFVIHMAEKTSFQKRA